jgi:hypothetical protein
MGYQKINSLYKIINKRCQIIKPDRDTGFRLRYGKKAEPFADPAFIIGMKKMLFAHFLSFAVCTKMLPPSIGCPVSYPELSKPLS